MKVDWVKVKVSLRAWFNNLNWKSVAAGLVAGYVITKLFL
jgi:hypothetical protein